MSNLYLQLSCHYFATVLVIFCVIVLVIVFVFVFVLVSVIAMHFEIFFVIIFVIVESLHWLIGKAKRISLSTDPNLKTKDTGANASPPQHLLIFFFAISSIFKTEIGLFQCRLVSAFVLIHIPFPHYIQLPTKLHGTIGVLLHFVYLSSHLN